MNLDFDEDQIDALTSGEVLVFEDDNGSQLQLALVSVLTPPPRSTAHAWHLVSAVACDHCDSLMAGDDSNALSDDLLTGAPPCPGPGASL